MFLLRNILVVTFLLFGVIGLTWGVEFCYYCSPDDEGCDDVKTSHIGEMKCALIQADNDSLPTGRLLAQGRLRAGSGPIGYYCAALHIHNSENKNLSGVYRTCLVNTTTDGCNVLKKLFEEAQYGKALSCYNCTTDNCNNQLMDYIDKNMAVTNFSSVLILSIISLLFVNLFLK